MQTSTLALTMTVSERMLGDAQGQRHSTASTSPAPHAACALGKHRTTPLPSCAPAAAHGRASQILARELHQPASDV